MGETHSPSELRSPGRFTSSPTIPHTGQDLRTVLSGFDFDSRAKPITPRTELQSGRIKRTARCSFNARRRNFSLLCPIAEQQNKRATRPRDRCPSVAGSAGTERTSGGFHGRMTTRPVRGRADSSGGEPGERHALPLDRVRSNVFRTDELLSTVHVSAKSSGRTRGCRPKSQFRFLQLNPRRRLARVLIAVVRRLGARGQGRLVRLRARTEDKMRAHWHRPLFFAGRRFLADR